MRLSQLEGKEYKKYSGAKFAYKTDTKVNHIKDDKGCNQRSFQLTYLEVA
jgi:hypothetical protein